MKIIYPKVNISLLILIFMSVSFLVFFYGDILTSPNDYMFSYSRDALKNYANFKYHLQFDESFLNYDGVFYPYGESIIFTDIHPLLASFYKGLSFIFPNIGNYSVGIINTQILLSFIITSVVLFFVFIKLKTSRFAAIFGAFSISVLSSHILLLQYGHWALSYAWAIPLAWYLLIQFLDSKNKIKWSILIAVNTLFWFLTHGYQGLSTLLFTATVFLVILFKNFKNKNHLLLFSKYFAIQVLTPTLLYLILVKGLDNHSLRIDAPFMTAYISDINFVLTPNYSFLKPIFNFFSDFAVKDVFWGDIGNYIGVFTIIVTTWFLSRYSKYKSILKQDNFNLFIPASIIILVYSFGIPFKYNLQFLLDYVPQAKQFAAIGRFAWVFYFVITVFSFYLIDKLVKRNLLRYSIIFFGALLMTIEGSAYHNKMSKFIKNPNILKTENIPTVYKSILDIDADKYQAVITLPMFIEYGSPYVHNYTAKAGYLYSVLPSFTGLPSMNAVISRPAINEGRNIMQIFSPNNYQKAIQNNLKSEKPFLILFTKEKLKKQEQDFLSKCTLIKSTTNYELYEISYDDIFNFDATELNSELKNAKDSFSIRENFYLSDSTYFYFNNFDKITNDTTLFGSGAFSKLKIEEEAIIEINCSKIDLNKTYNLSFWYYNEAFNQAFTAITMHEYNPYENKNIQSIKVHPLHYNIFYGNWCYVELDFMVSEKSNILILESSSTKEFIDNSLYIDNLMIRESNTDCYNQLSDSIMIKNNHIYSLSE